MKGEILLSQRNLRGNSLKERNLKIQTRPHDSVELSQKLNHVDVVLLDNSEAGKDENSEENNAIDLKLHMEK